MGDVLRTPTNSSKSGSNSSGTDGFSRSAVPYARPAIPERRETGLLSQIIGVPDREVWVVAGPTLVASLVIAELFYKFHSFILEAVAMLATWWILNTLTRLVLSLSRDSDSAS
jgi:hypothetical protein